MSSAWLLPEHIADVLPSQARRIEELRRSLLDKARSYGFELVMPPLLEYLESLLTGTGRALDLQTFKLVDQLSGRTLGLRADTTAQAARIDAHLLNRQGVVRLCYCGPVVHTLPAAPHAPREPLQFGAEVFGHAGMEADLEVCDLAVDVLKAAGIQGLVVDLADARLVRALVSKGPAAHQAAVLDALARKDRNALKATLALWPQAAAAGMLALLALYGGEDVLTRARQTLTGDEAIDKALDELHWLAAHLKVSYPDVQVGFDLADVGGYAYYTGVRFGIYAKGSSTALARGGRYDEVGAAFGRSRPAVGFSLDLKTLADHAAVAHSAQAVLAPWGEAASLRAAIRRLREQGETVVCLLPGHEQEQQEFNCDRALVAVDDVWVLQVRAERHAG
jgi:ATP phosphoribosyltransferase regulatory subunit